MQLVMVTICYFTRLGFFIAGFTLRSFMIFVGYCISIIVNMAWRHWGIETLDYLADDVALLTASQGH